MATEKKATKTRAPKPLVANITNKLPTFKFGLGWVLRDEVTGFEGVVVYRCDNITGCNQYGLSPNKRKHGTETKHIDEGRLTYTGDVVQIPITAEEITKAPGGVSRIPVLGPIR